MTKGKRTNEKLFRQSLGSRFWGETSLINGWILKRSLGFPGESVVKNRRRHGVQSLGQEDPLEKEMATYSNILTWKIPWTEEPGRMQAAIHGVSKELDMTLVW